MVELCGADKPLTIKDWRAILNCLASHKVEKAMIVRVKEDKSKEYKWFSSASHRRTHVLDELMSFICE